MSHDDFIFGYQAGSFGCSVDTLGSLKLLCSRKSFRQQIRLSIVFWLTGLLVLVAGGIILLTALPLLWAIVGCGLAILLSAMLLSHSVAGLVIELALRDGCFFEQATAGRVLFVTVNPAADVSATAPPFKKPFRRHSRH